MKFKEKKEEYYFLMPEINIITERGKIFIKKWSKEIAHEILRLSEFAKQYLEYKESEETKNIMEGIKLLFEEKTIS